MSLTPDNATNEDIEEEAFSAHTSAVTDTSVFLRVEGVEKRAVNQVRGPD
jgi:hypothetical protein